MTPSTADPGPCAEGMTSLEVRYDFSTGTGCSPLGAREARTLLLAFVTVGVLAILAGVFLAEGSGVWFWCIAGVVSIPLGMCIVGPDAWPRRSTTPQAPVPDDAQDAGPGPVAVFTLEERGVRVPSPEAPGPHPWSVVTLRERELPARGRREAPRCLELIVPGATHVYPASGLSPSLEEILATAAELRRD